MNQVPCGRPSTNHLHVHLVLYSRNTISFETVVKRWPVILTGIIDTIYRVNHDLSLSSDPDLHNLGDVSVVDQDTRERIEEGKKMIEKLSKLKYEMGRDRPLQCVELSLFVIMS